MQGLHYRAIDEQGQVHLGFAFSQDQSELLLQLQRRGWQLLPASSMQRLANAVGFGPRLPRWPKSAAALFTLQLSQLLDAGVPLLSALQELVDLESQRSIRTALQEIKNKVDQGSSLSDAMKASGGLFGPDYIASVCAGESSGELSQCLRLQAKNLQWQSELSERLKTIMAYPVFALVCLVVVFLFVLLYLVPAMLPLLSMNENALPVQTQWLLMLSNILQSSGLIILGLVGIIVMMIYGLWQSDNIVKWRMQALLMRSVYGQIMTNFSLARYARSTSLLYESGVEFTDAMRISQNMVSNSLLQKQLNSACQQILSGESIANAMQSQQSLPRLFVRMVSAGEHAGVMDVALRQCADQLQLTAQYSLDRAERLIGPSLLCVMGGLLLWVVLAVLGPIYSTIGTTGVFS